MNGGNCLICNGNLPPLSSSPKRDDCQSANYVGENKTSNVSSSFPSSSLINQHVHTVFILKTIFQLPSTRLTKYLKNCPNIENWITLCSNCEQVVNDCKSIYNDLLKIQWKLVASRFNVIKLVKTNYTGDSGGDQLSGKDQQFNVSQDCRRFIIKRKYTEIEDNPFINGDSQALNKLIAKLSSAVKQEEPPVEIKIEEDDDAHSQISEQVIVPNIHEEDDDHDDDYDRQWQIQPISEQVPFSKKEDDDDWQPQPNYLESDSPSSLGSDSDSDYSIASPQIKSKRHKAVQRKYKFSAKSHCKSEFLSTKSKELTSISASFSCYLCLYTFSSKADLIAHKVKVHNLPQRQYRSLDSSSKPSKRKTNNYRRSSSKYQCSICNHVLSGPFSLRRHVAVRHNFGFQKRYPGCSKSFPNSNKLPLHKSTKLALHKCRHCEKGFFDRESLKNHENLHKTDPNYLPFPCYLCPLGFTTKSALTTHKAEVHKSNLPQPESQPLDLNSTDAKSPEPTKPYNCTLCPSNFTLRTNLQRHLQQIHNQKVTIRKKSFKEAKHRCPHCPSKFTFPGSLTRHLQTLHNQEPEKSFECTLCPRKFANHGDLRKHCRMLHKVELEPAPKPTATCETCGLIFKTKESMKAHQKNNPKCRPFHYKDNPVKDTTSVICEICGAKFAHKYSMLNHIRHEHENKYEFNCDICPPGKLKGFVKEHDYKYHLFCKHGIGREEDVKKWLCPEDGCGKRLESESELKYHLDWHKGIKRFKCEECGKGFNRPGYLNIHKRRVHGWKGRKWKCEICKKEYQSEENMRIHLEAFHFKKGKKKEVKKGEKN